MQEDLIEMTGPEIPVYLFTGFLEAGKGCAQADRALQRTEMHAVAVMLV